MISTGLTKINVAANPFASMLVDPEGTHQQNNFCSGIFKDWMLCYTGSCYHADIQSD